MTPSFTGVVAAVCAMTLCGLLNYVCKMQERLLNQASGGGTQKHNPAKHPLPLTRRPPLLHYPHSIKDLIRCSDCLKGAFKSEKGLPRDYSGVSRFLTLLGWRRMNSGRLAEH